MSRQTLLTVRNLKKKFSSDIKYNMYYGILDLIYDSFGVKVNQKKLRANEFWALNDVSFDFKEGEILGIVGSNGSGKTTLMRVLSKIYPLEMGTIKGKSGQKIIPIFALRSGMMPLFTGRENIFIKGAMYGMSKAEIKEQMAFIEEFSELGKHLDSPFGNYSSGMKARLGFAVALSTKPDVFIIDEALAVGDSVFKAKCYDYLKDYVKQPGKGVLFVSNNIRKILKVATRVLVMDNGNLIYNSEDITASLNFYISHCLRDLEEGKKQKMLLKIQNYDM